MNTTAVNSFLKGRFNMNQKKTDSIVAVPSKLQIQAPDSKLRSNPNVIIDALPPAAVKAPMSYGYESNAVEMHTDIIPMSFLEFGLENIKKEFGQKRYGFDNDPYNNITDRYEANKIRRYRRSISQLKLNDKNIWAREQQRDHIECPRFMMIVYYSICYVLDMIYKDNPIGRFWFLETVARMPYFSYVAIIHMYETLGWWELDSSLKRAHAIEEANETHHLRIMESLGGNVSWWNRFLARHGAMAYYGVLLVLFMTSPRIAYLSSELLEMHAVDTYTEFYESNARILRELPPTQDALRYKPDAWNMYDVFRQIAVDEFKHAQNMKYIRALPNKKEK